MSIENVQDRDIWIGSNSDCLILVCARSDNAGRRLLDLLSQERALKRDESWKVFLVLCPMTRDEVARADLMVVNSCYTLRARDRQRQPSRVLRIVTSR